MGNYIGIDGMCDRVLLRTL